MILKELKLKNYKNLNTGFNFQNGINILIYPNGWGKTNLLEAIDYLSSLKSFRGLGDSEMKNWESGDDYFKIHAKCLLDKPVELEVIISSDPGNSRAKKTVKISGANTTPKKFRSQLATFMYSPHNADIVSSTPDIRRNQFDRYISEFDADYDKILKEYRFVLKSRNKLLARISEGRESEMQLDYWDTRFVNLGEEILTKRLKLLADLEEYIYLASKELYKNGFDLRINYSSKVVENQVLRMKEKLASGRMKEIQAGMGLYGPHRDDYEFLLNGNLLRTAGSRGQQRIAGIILLFALNSLFNKDFSVSPVLLFDDIFSELDEKHRVNIENSLLKLNNQIFITSSQKELFTGSFLKKINLV
ncbi:DNA replication/repair protein RecF [Candidatus Dojkabacteria bacterium]|nr:DNA replication/repair protein RecF [Candidatus Dojkabacteria bacterium]